MLKDNLNIHIANWNTDKDSLAKMRRQVFIEEQNIPEDMEWDEHDNSSTHFLATHNDKVIACARLKTDGQIGRMAVLAEYRNKGIGRKLLRFILKHAARHQFKRVYLHAQTAAIPFYEKQGFVVQGELFYEADIPHRKMSLAIL